MDMTIDDLARAVAMSARNIREWQTLRLVPAPQRKGRVGVYSDAHVARIERIKQLRAEGFPLELIRRMLDAADPPAAQVDRVAEQALTPFGSAVRPVTTTTAALVEQFGDGADGALCDAGVVTVDGKGAVGVPDPVLLDLFGRFVALGLPHADAARVVAALDDRLHDAAELAMNAFRQHVWAPFVDAGLPAQGWQPLADSMTEIRSSATELGSRLFQHALDDAAQAAIATEIRHLGLLAKAHDTTPSVRSPR